MLNQAWIALLDERKDFDQKAGLKVAGSIPICTTIFF